MQLTFIDRLNQPKPLVAIGSFESPHLHGEVKRPELLPLYNPLYLEETLSGYVEMGVELLFTPTERASCLWLEQVQHSNKVYELNRKAVWIARKAGKDCAYVAGVIGPPPNMLRPLGSLAPDILRRTIVEQAIALLDGGCDTIVLKSFVELEELSITLEALLPLASKTPIIALKSFPEDGAVLATSYPADIARLLTGYNIAAVGASGTVGPQRMQSIIASMRQGTNLPLVALPDTGIPTTIAGKAFFHSDPDYVARSVLRIAELGARVVGTDRGTTFDHIRALVTALEEASPEVQESRIAEQRGHLMPVVESRPPSRFSHALRTRFVTTVELDIPRGLNMQSVIEGARYLREHGIDAVNISDGARARLRVNSIMLSAIVQQQAGIDCITHLACRDRNLVALQSDLLGASLLGVQNILAVTGDPTNIGDFPRASTVGDIDSIGLIRALRMMNTGRDLAGNPLGAATNFCIACACNPCANDLEYEIDRLALKVAEGAEAVITQPMFDAEAWVRFKERVESLPAHFIVGVLPLRSLRHAEFLHYEVPGMEIPEWVRERLRHAPSAAAAADEGIAIASEFLVAVHQHCHGVYLLPPFRRYALALDVIHRAGIESHLSRS